MSFGRIDPRRWGLRTKLLAYTVGIIALVLAAASLWSVHNLRIVLRDRNDAFLWHEIGEFLRASRRVCKTGEKGRDPYDEYFREAQSSEEEGLYVLLVHDGQKHIFPEGNRPDSFAAALGDGVVHPTARTIEHPVLPAGVRVVGAVLPVREGPPWTVQLGLPLVETEATVSAFVTRLGAGWLVFLLLALVGGLVVTRQALQPVANSIAAARKLGPADLTTRLPLTGIGDELDLLAGTVNDLLDRLARYHEQIVQFTADASHELRGPLTAIRAAVEIALQQPRSAEEYQEFLSSLAEQCQRLVELVNNLLLLANADAGEVELNFQPVDLAEIVAEAIETYQPLADEKGVHLQWPGAAPAICSGDRLRLLQLAMNLIDNAIKFTPPEGTIDVSLQNQKSTALLKIDDTGVGVAPDKLPRLFERLYRADDSRSSKGSGLGLSICRWVVNSHGGKIEAQLRPHHGISMQVTIPLTASANSNGQAK